MSCRLTQKVFPEICSSVTGAMSSDAASTGCTKFGIAGQIENKGASTAKLAAIAVFFKGSHPFLEHTAFRVRAVSTTIVKRR